MQNQKKVYWLGGLVVLFWSTMGTAFKWTLRYTSPEMLLLIASTASCFCVGFILVLTQKWKLLRQTKLKEIGSSLLMGFFNPFAYYLILFEAYNLLPAQQALALNYLWPVMLVIFSIIFLKQKIRLVNILAIALSFLGMLVIALKGQWGNLQFENLVGVLLAAGSSLLFAGFWILNLKDKREEGCKLFLNFCFGCFYVWVWVLCRNHLVFPPIEGILGGIYIGFFEMGLTFVLWLTALKLSSHTARISNLAFLSPFLSLLFVSIFIGEKILPSTFAGLVLIVAGILLPQLVKKRIAE